MKAFIHPQAHVDDDVKLGAGTRVWQFASITRGTVMGEDCSVSPGAMLDGSVYGDRVIVSGGVKAGAGFKVGDDVFLGPNVVLCNDCWPFATKDGYRDDLLRDGKHFAVVIGNGAAIGAGAVIPARREDRRKGRGRGRRSRRSWCAGEDDPMPQRATPGRMCRRTGGRSACRSAEEACL